MSYFLTYRVDSLEFSDYNNYRKEVIMKEKELRRSMAVFPIGTVMKLTDLTARQIRYNEDQGLITPERTSGNRRMF